MKKSILHKIGSISFLLLGLFYFAALLFQVNPENLFGAQASLPTSSKSQQFRTEHSSQAQLQNAIEIEQVQVELMEVEEEEEETLERQFILKDLNVQASIDLLASHQYDCTDRLRVQRDCHANQSAKIEWYLLYEVFRL